MRACQTDICHKNCRPCHPRLSPELSKIPRCIYFRGLIFLLFFWFWTHSAGGGIDLKSIPLETFKTHQIEIALRICQRMSWIQRNGTSNPFRCQRNGIQNHSAAFRYSGTEDQKQKLSLQCNIENVNTIIHRGVSIFVKSDYNNLESKPGVLNIMSMGDNNTIRFWVNILGKNTDLLTQKVT